MHSDSEDLYQLLYVYVVESDLCSKVVFCRTGLGGAQESLAECRAAALLTFKAEMRALSIPPAPLVAGGEAC